MPNFTLFQDMFV